MKSVHYETIAFLFLSLRNLENPCKVHVKIWVKKEIQNCSKSLFRTVIWQKTDHSPGLALDVKPKLRGAWNRFAHFQL